MPVFGERGKDHLCPALSLLLPSVTPTCHIGYQAALFTVKCFLNWCFSCDASHHTPGLPRGYSAFTTELYFTLCTAGQCPLALATPLLQNRAIMRAWPQAHLCVHDAFGISHRARESWSLWTPVLHQILAPAPHFHACAAVDSAQELQLLKLMQVLNRHNP